MIHLKIQTIIQIVLLLFIVGKFNIYLLYFSAGIGRSGTFIAIYIIISYLEKINDGILFFNVFNVVRKLREQRYKMVTTVEQYKYIYEIIFIWIEREKTRIRQKNISK
jgi:protein tyrosine phosphatase